MSGIAVSRYLWLVLWSEGLPWHPIENTVLSEGWLLVPYDSHNGPRVAILYANETEAKNNATIRGFRAISSFWLSAIAHRTKAGPPMQSGETHDNKAKIQQARISAGFFVIPFLDTVVEIDVNWLISVPQSEQNLEFISISAPHSLQNTT